MEFYEPVCIIFIAVLFFDIFNICIFAKDF